MRFAALLAFGVFAAAAAASGQSRSFAAVHGQYGVGDPHEGPSARRRSRQDLGAVSCLVRKSDGQRVCRSLRQWREIARRMDGEGDDER